MHWFCRVALGASGYKPCPISVRHSSYRIHFWLFVLVNRCYHKLKMALRWSVCLRILQQQSLLAIFCTDLLMFSKWCHTKEPKQLPSLHTHMAKKNDSVVGLNSQSKAIRASAHLVTIGEIPLGKLPLIWQLFRDFLNLPSSGLPEGSGH